MRTVGTYWNSGTGDGGETLGVRDTEVAEEDWGGRKRMPNNEQSQWQALL